jgi:hypothetical protein
MPDPTHHFKDCQLEPFINEESSVVLAEKDNELDDASFAHDPHNIRPKYAATSFYLDASGRSRMSLPLRFTFPSKEALDDFLSNDCIHPIPTNIGEGEEEDRGEDNGRGGGPFGSHGDSKTSLGFEVTTVAMPVEDLYDGSLRSIYSDETEHEEEMMRRRNSAINQQRAIVEGITVRSSRIEGTSIIFETQVIVRAAQHDHSLLIKTRLQIVAILSEQPRDPPSQQSRMSYEGFPDFTLQTTLTASKVKQTKLEPFILEVTLTDALAIDVTSVTGPTTGRTLVSLVMRHPNTHGEPVTVTNIALHPGHSRLELPAPPGAPVQGVHTPTHTVADMSKCVQWGYAPQTQPKLPFTLYPQGAFATVLTIDAMEHMRSRTFKSPVSVTAVVGHPTKSKKESGIIGAQDTSKSNPTTISSADAQWTTGRLAQEPSDAFRIDMQLQNKDFYVGEPLTIFLRVKNLSAEARDMMLLVAKDSDKLANATGTMTTTSSSSTSPALAQPATNNLNASSHHAGNGARESLSYVQQQQQAQRSTVPNTAVVSEVNGYTFGVWGLIADADNPVFRLDRDQDLLAIDAALLLGEIKGHHSVEAQLRFNPLREGTLDVPNMQLFDKRNRKWYYCNHKLNIVARQKRTTTEDKETKESDSSSRDEED